MSALLLASVAFAQPKPLPLEKISLPHGFAIELVARVDNARQMTLGATGTLFVGSMRAGKVYAVRLRPGAPAEVLTLASGLQLPVGVAFHAGAESSMDPRSGRDPLATATPRRSDGAPPTGPCHAYT